MESRSIDLPTRVYVRPAEVTARLYELDLKREALVEAVHFGFSYAAECTLHDPKSLAGIVFWGKTVRKLRDQLIPDGWDVENRQNYPLTVHSSKRWAIGVAAGDERTGIPDKTPSTRSERGPATRQVVSINQYSFAALSADFAELDAALVRQTWLLMHYRDDEADEIRMELSLPAEMTPDGFVNQWKERIILRDDGGAALAHPVPAYDVGSDDDMIDIPVLKKA